MKILLDSDALFALYVAKDAHHLNAKRIFKSLLHAHAELWTTNLVVQETATVVSFRLGQKQAKEFLTRLRRINIRETFVSPKLSAKAWEIFRKQEKKGTSFVDCANVAVTKEMRIKDIFSFDKIYNRMGMTLLKDQ